MYTFQYELFTKVDSNIQKAQHQYKKKYDKNTNQKKVYAAMFAGCRECKPQLVIIS